MHGVLRPQALEAGPQTRKSNMNLNTARGLLIAAAAVSAFSIAACQKKTDDSAAAANAASTNAASANSAAADANNAANNANAAANNAATNSASANDAANSASNSWRPARTPPRPRAVVPQTPRSSSSNCQRPEAFLASGRCLGLTFARRDPVGEVRDDLTETRFQNRGGGLLPTEPMGAALRLLQPGVPLRRHLQREHRDPASLAHSGPEHLEIVELSPRGLLRHPALHARFLQGFERRDLSA